VLETTTLSPGVAPRTSQLTVNDTPFFWHDANISFPAPPSIGAVVRFFNSKSVPKSLLGVTLATVSLSSSSVGSGLLSFPDSCSSSSSIVCSSSVPISVRLINCGTSVIPCPFEFSTLRARLTTMAQAKGNTSPYLMILFVE
jgi:hypothetical protein